jgi:hypothetical protein
MRARNPAGCARDDTGAGRAELLLQFEPGHLGHSYIEQQVAALSRVIIWNERAGRWNASTEYPAAQHKS